MIVRFILWLVHKWGKQDVDMDTGLLCSTISMGFIVLTGGYGSYGSTFARIKVRSWSFMWRHTEDPLYSWFEKTRLYKAYYNHVRKSAVLLILRLFSHIAKLNDVETDDWGAETACHKWHDITFHYGTTGATQIWHAAMKTPGWSISVDNCMYVLDISRRKEVVV